MAKYNKLSIHQVHTQNPFLSELGIVPIKQRRVFAGKAGDVIVQSDTGELKGHTAFMAIKEYDQEQFVKVFTDGIKAIYDLSKAEHRLFYFIMSITRPNTDWIYFDLDDAKEFTGYKSKAAILSSMSGLVAKEIIAISKKRNIYFINPKIFFNGNRVSFIKSAVLKNRADENNPERRLDAIKKLGEGLKSK